MFICVELALVVLLVEDMEEEAVAVVDLAVEVDVEKVHQNEVAEAVEEDMEVMEVLEDNQQEVVEEGMVEMEEA